MFYSPQFKIIFLETAIKLQIAKENERFKDETC